MNHKNSWKQLSDSKISNLLSHSAISSRRIKIPETLFKFFSIDKDKNIDLIFMYGDEEFSATIKYSSDNRRELLWYQHLSEKIRTTAWWGTISNPEKIPYSHKSDIYLNITKTNSQKNAPSESGEYIKCDIFKVSITTTDKDEKTETLDDKSQKKISSEMPFGNINGIKEGKIFLNRKELGLSGIHKPTMHGIWGREAEGSASIVISGDYKDDIDEGNYILYTGQGGQDTPGGKQIKDQEFTRGNKGLQLNKEYNLPVRVTRGYQVEKGPEKGYRYDGLYYVTDYERVKGKEGFYICRFHLKKEIVSSLIEDIEHPTSPTERFEYTGNRLKRNINFAEEIKELYNNTCQVCKVFLKTPIDGIGISEAAHIKAIGSPHDGPDTKANMLCLCPNHHSQFDRYTFYIDPVTLEVVGLDDYKGTSISLSKKHKVNVEYFEYQKLQHLKNKQK